MRAFSFAFPVAPACGRVTAERRKPPARLPAGLEGMRVHAHPRPAGCRRVPSAPPENEEARLARAFSFAFPVAPARWRVTAERRKPPARLPAGLEGMRRATRNSRLHPYATALS
ncbi:hypothetical protein C6P75_16530 [Burkholderia multivorans]|nr:hypothetical protein C6P75_16530 [Burkholderia multivorans]